MVAGQYLFHFFIDREYGGSKWMKNLYLGVEQRSSKASGPIFDIIIPSLVMGLLNGFFLSTITRKENVVLALVGSVFVVVFWSLLESFGFREVWGIDMTILGKAALVLFSFIIIFFAQDIIRQR